MSNSPQKHLDPWSEVIIVLTFLLFAIALFYKGLTHDMLLEAGVFLVSLKLILMAHKSSIVGQMLQERLDRIQETLRRMESTSRAQ
jgi:hypothetical protein